MGFVAEEEEEVGLAAEWVEILRGWAWFLD